MNQANIHTQTNRKQSWNQALKRFEHHFVFPFENRSQYCDFTRLWKENYAALSLLLRDQKQVIRATQRRSEYAGKHQQRCIELKHEATIQLEMRQSAKAESNRQYLAAKESMKS